MLTRHLLLSLTASCLVLHCAGSQENPDGGSDAAADSPVTKDAGKDVTADAPKDVALDNTAQDAPADSPIDSPIDSPVDAPLDVAVDSPPDASSDGGTISSISGLVLWLDAAKGVTTNGNDITAWSDQSTQGNDATGGTPTATLVSSSINSLPAAHFDATSLQFVSIADATSLQWGTGDFFVAIVAKFDNDPNNSITSGLGSLYTKLGSGSGLLFFANDFQYPSTVVAGLSNLEDPTPTEVDYAASYNDGAARLYVIQRASGSEYLRVNGTQVASSTSSIDVSESGHDVFIGLMEQGDAALDGDIAEVIAVQGTLQTSDRGTIESYLTNKYGL